jgi:hypothetical protein
MGARKQAISVRIGEADLGNLRRLARRLGVRDSDVIRVAIKSLLAKWSPLHDASVRGKNLVPVFLENGSDLFRHFELDTPRLDSIINEGAGDDGRVEMEDIQLIAMSGIQRSYLRWRLDQVGNHNTTDSATTDNKRVDGEGDSVEQTLRQYLYEKYVHVRTDGSVVK